MPNHSSTEKSIAPHAAPLTALASRAIPYELRVGVTGHRELSVEQAAGVDLAVRRVLGRIERTLVDGSARPAPSVPGSWRNLREGLARLGAYVDVGLTVVVRALWRSVPRQPGVVPDERQAPLRWIVVSPLAKGADRIVARAVLDREPSPLDPQQMPPRLEVVLPMPVDEYRRDFRDPEDLQEFEELYGRADWTNADDALLTTDVAPGELRNAAYRMAGHEVTNRCDLLIAVWDGRPPAGGGGTGEIVPYAVRQGRPVLWINSLRPEEAPVLLTSAKTARPWPVLGENDPMTGVFIDEFPQRAKGLSLGFHRLAAFQRDTALDPGEYAAKLNDYAVWFQKLDRDHGLSPAATVAVVEKLMPHLARANLLANRYQYLYLGAVTRIYALALAAITVAVAQQVFWPERHAIVVLEVLALVAAWSLLRVNRREQWQEKYHNDRYLAEWLRRAQFTVLLPPAGFVPTAGQLSLYHGPETWFVQALGRIITATGRDIHGAAPASPGDSLQGLKSALIDGWIGLQAAWHTDKAHREDHHARWGRRLTFWLFVATLTMAVVHWLFGHALHGTPGQIVTLLAIVLPACAAAMHSIERVRDHDRTAARSRQMAKLLDRLADRLRAAENMDELREAAREIDEALAEEVEEWWVAGTLQRPGEPV